uniref:Uncharacterized protein n=1 Tax=viral metagenome TaxID=1070528 RepID=A0A6M3K7N0_9ZZZZ
MAAPTIVRSGNFIEVSVITEDVFSWQIFRHKTPPIVKVKRIEFIVGAANNVMVIKQSVETGPEITRLGSAAAAESDRCYFEGGQYMEPFIDFGDCTLNAGHKVIFELE